MRVKRPGQKLYIRCVKPALDFCLSLLAIVALSPLLALTAILVRLKLGSPVLFKQPRPGKDETIFYLYKFRSMTNELDQDGRLLPDKQRLTRFGRFLRASSIDELPELFNILRGDMSIVGPRPLSIYYLPHYPPAFRRRQSVRPGLTGLAQVNGRDRLAWNERFSLDLQYVDAASLALDVRIVLSTVLKVLRHEGVSVRGMTKLMDYGPYRVLEEENHTVKPIEGASYSEIGSYFWLDGSEETAPVHPIDWLPPAEDSCFTFSGRNAIALALGDILHSAAIKTVYVPSYCCVSMLQAFLDRGLPLRFYRVEFREGRFQYELPELEAGALVLVMSYFGLDAAAAHDLAAKAHRMGAVVMEDITHSLMRAAPACPDSDYLVASLRKWFAIPTGGWLGKQRGTLWQKPDLDSNHTIAEKLAGMREKYAYLTGKTRDKERFLFAQSTFENDLIHVDTMLRLDDSSRALLERVDAESVVARRRNNAGILAAGLRDLDGTVLTLPEMDLRQDVPLFLPIFMQTADRDALRAFLIQKGIYCPIHWPEVMGAPEGVRENELSLLCDQRYAQGDMKALVSAVHDWYRTYSAPLRGTES